MEWKSGEGTKRLTVALLSLWAGVRPCSSSLSSVVSSPLALLDMIRKLGTLSLRAAILSLRFVRYLFSIMLCAVFLTGWSASSSSSSISAEDFLFLRTPFASVCSGDEVPSGCLEPGVPSCASLPADGNGRCGMAIIRSASRWSWVSDEGGMFSTLLDVFVCICVGVWLADGSPSVADVGNIEGVDTLWGLFQDWF